MRRAPLVWAAAALCAAAAASAPSSAPLDWADIDSDGRAGDKQALEERCTGTGPEAVCLDQYSGQAVAASAIEVDHILSRKRAAEIYARGDRATWRRFVNDQGNLALTLRATNRSKGARGPEAFCPELPAARIWYARRWSETAARWNLDVTDGERAALAELAAGRCAK